MKSVLCPWIQHQTRLHRFLNYYTWQCQSPFKKTFVVSLETSFLIIQWKLCTHIRGCYVTFSLSCLYLSLFSNFNLEQRIYSILKYYTRGWLEGWNISKLEFTLYWILDMWRQSTFLLTVLNKWHIILNSSYARQNTTDSCLMAIF